MAELTKKSDNRSFWGSLLRLKREPEEIPGFQVGSIVSEDDLLIAATAAVAGDLTAPQITVHGLVCGQVGARDLIIGETGQIWGDVYAAAVHIEPGGQLHGWLTTLPETAVARLLNQETTLSELSPEANEALATAIEQSGLKDSLAQLDDPTPSAHRLDLLHEIQALAGNALVARAELDQVFEERVKERAGEAMREAVDLRNSIAVLQEHIRGLQDATLDRDDEIAAHQTELTAVRELLHERTGERDELRTLHKQRQTELARLQEGYEAVRQNLKQAIAERQTLNDRLANMEAALQASLQRAAEQEEALVHWQELADATEHRVIHLESELANSRQLNRGNEQRIELLHSQRQKLEKAYNELTDQLIEQKEKSKQLERQAAEYVVRIDALQEQLTSRPPTSEEALAQLQADHEEIAAANGRVLELESYLQRLEVEAKDYFDQLVVYKADLEDSRRQLSANQVALQERTQQLARAQADLAEQQDQVDAWKTNVGHMTELLYEAELKVKQVSQELADRENEAQSASSKLAEQLQDQQVQLEATEAEAMRYHRELQAQSQRLAEAQATLVERELAVKRLEGLLAQTEDEFNRLKKAAVVRIQKLEKALAQTANVQ